MGLLLVLISGPRDIILDAWIAAIQQGGAKRPYFLQWMAAIEPETMDVADILEQSSLSGEFEEPDYRLYKKHLREHSAEETAPLIEHMLRTNPLLAMDALLDVYPDHLPDAEAVLDDHWTLKKIDWKYDHSMLRGDAPWETRDAFNRLSRHDVWWVRLYAVSAMNRRGPFRLEHRLKALHDDPSESVGRAAKAISPPKDQRGGASRN